MEKAVYFKALYEIGRQLNESVEPDRVLNVLVESVTEALAARACSILLLTPERSHLTHRAWYGLSDQYVRKGPLKADVILSSVLRGRPQAILDVTRDIRIHYRDAAVREGIASIISIPISHRGEVIGVLRVYSARVREFSAGEIEFMTAAANLGAVALQRTQSREKLVQECAENRLEIDRLRRELAVSRRSISAA